MNNYFYYFFSTVPQVLGAVLALFGVFVVFKIQTIKDDLLGLAQAIRDRTRVYVYEGLLIDKCKDVSPTEFLRYIDELIQRNGIDTLVKKFAELSPNLAFESQIKQYSANYEVLKGLTRKTIIWSLFTASTIFLCVIILAFANYILSDCYLRNISFGVILLFIFLCFCGVIEILSEALSDHTFWYLVKNYIIKKTRDK